MYNLYNYFKFEKYFTLQGVCMCKIDLLALNMINIYLYLFLQLVKFLIVTITRSKHTIFTCFLKKKMPY